MKPRIEQAGQTNLGPTSGMKAVKSDCAYGVPSQVFGKAGQPGPGSRRPNRLEGGPPGVASGVSGTIHGGKVSR